MLGLLSILSLSLSLEKVISYAIYLDMLCLFALLSNESLKGKQLDVTPGASNDKQIFTPMLNKSSV